MRLLEFSTRFPDEAPCVAKLREAEIHVCPKRPYRVVQERRQALLRVQEMPPPRQPAQGNRNGELQAHVPDRFFAMHKLTAT